MSNSEIKLKKDSRTLLIYVAVPIRGTKRFKWICTGERSYAKAREMVTTVGLDRLLHLHHASALTAESIQLVTAGRPTTCREAFGQWRDWITPMRAERTVRAYVGYLEHFMAGNLTSRASIGDITEDMVRDYINQPDRCYNSLSVRHAALRSLFKFAHARGLVATNPVALVEINTRNMPVDKLEPKHYQPVPEEGYRKLLALTEGQPVHDWVVLAYCTGLRISDCISLEWASVQADHLVVYPLKGRNFRAKRLAVPLSDPFIARPELLELVARLKAGEREDTRHVWPNDECEFNRFDQGRRGISDRLTKLFRKAGLPGYSFHCLRTAFARRLEAAGESLERIAGRMAHSSTNTTKVYLTPSEPALFPVGMDLPAVRTIDDPAPAPAAVPAMPESNGRIERSA